MLNKKETLNCKCDDLPIKSERAILGKECVCKTEGRSGRGFNQVIIEKTKDEN